MATPSHTKIQFLYIVSSGNADSIYKIGISDDPSRRIKEIRDTYNVPRASIVDEMDVPDREQVFALENTLHTRFASKRTRKYGGKEWFKLSASDLAWLRSLCTEQSDSFAQATAYFGLHQRAWEIKDRYYELEEERQRKIKYNRVNGKTYDTKPSGLNKEYDNLYKKISGSHLGKRFTLKSYDHPAKELVTSTAVEVKASIKQSSPSHGVIGVLMGIASAAIIGISTGVDVTSMGFFTTIGCGLTGVIAGDARRGKVERESISELREIIKQRYGSGCLDLELAAVIDNESHKSYLVKDFNETAMKLRQQPALLPKVAFEDKPDFLSKVRAKKHFNLAPLAVAGMVSLGILGSYAGHELELQEERNSYRSSLIQQQRMS